MGIYGKLKKSAASVSSRGSLARTTRSQGDAAGLSYVAPTPSIQNVSSEVADTDFDPPEESTTIPADAAVTAVAASVAASIAASSNAASPPDNITVPATGTGLRSIIGSNGSDGSDNSKKKALLGGEDDHIGSGGNDDDITETKSIVSKASSFFKSALSVNNSTIATNMSCVDSLHSTSTKGSNFGGVEKAKPMKDRMMERSTMCCAALLAFWLGLSKVAQVSLLAGAALGAVGVVSLIAVGGRAPAFPAHINVAFVGNSYFYVNDLPRFVEKIGGGHISQDSVLHNSASVLEILMTGNGMWNKWATKSAMINGVKFDTDQGATAYLYDMGACSVPQLLTGQDQMITQKNALGSFVDDGQNPCFQEDAYRQYQESFDLKVRGGWDFVVITDQSKVMALDETRQDTLAAFNYTYGPILKKKNISPIIVQPHGYGSGGDANSTTLSELASFTALIMEGAVIYKKYLGHRTGWFSHAHVAPVGNAFLAIYEVSPNDLYPKLFMDDGVHPSAYGTFIYGCVIYATMTGYMPKYSRVVVDDMENSELFASARRLQASSSSAGFPTKDEAAFLYKIAKKVALRRYKPQVLRGYQIESDATDFLAEDEDYNNDYQGDYQDGQQYYQNSYNNYQNGGGNNGYNNDYYQDQNDGNGNYYQNNGGNNYNGDGNNNYQGNYQNYNNNGNNYNGQYGGNYGQQQNDNGNNYNGQYGGNYGQQQNNNGNNYNGQYGGNYGNDDAAQQQNNNDNEDGNGNYQQYYYNNN